MAKLGIYYKKPQEGWMNLENSEWLTNIYNANSSLYIGTKETRTLKEMVKKVTEELRKRTLLKEDEELEIVHFNEKVGVANVSNN